MTEPRSDRDVTRTPAEQRDESRLRYPEGHVLSIMDTPEQLRQAITQLIDTGVRQSEIHFGSGAETADAVDATTGRTGLADLAIRFAEWIGAKDEEMEMKDRYEQALRAGRFVVSVQAASDERKALAARILREHGGHFINYLGRYSIEVLER